jgi:hypothetical protein
MKRLHPQSMQDLRQLVKLHGVDRLIIAIRQIAKEPTPRMSVNLPIPKTAAERCK